MNTVVKYTIYGVLFGFMFPVMATAFEFIRLELPTTFSSFKQIHEVNPLLYMIDSAPIWLGLFAMLGGISKSKSLQLLNTLKKLSKELQQNSKELKLNSSSEFQNLNIQAERLTNIFSEASDHVQNVNYQINGTTSQAKILKEEADFVISNTQKLIHINENLKTENNSLTEIILKFVRKVKEMEKHLSKVGSLGYEINTLSINSSIEAYKLGIKGSSFSVIAKNIKTLSEEMSVINTTLSDIAKDIETNISEISKKIEVKKNMLEETSQLSSNIDSRISDYEINLRQLIESINRATNVNERQNKNFSEVNLILSQLIQTKENMVESIEELINKEFYMINQLSSQHE